MTLEAVMQSPLARMCVAAALLEVDGARPPVVRIVDADPHARTMLGNGPRLLGFPPRLDPAAEVGAAALREEPRFLGVTRGVLPNGPAWLAVHLVPLSVHRVVALWIPAAEVQPTDALDALEALEARTRVLAHNFNNVLQVMDGNLELALDGFGVTERLTSLSEVIVRAHELSSQLARMARPAPVGAAEVDLSAEVEVASASIRQVLPSTVTFTIRPPGAHPSIGTARRELQRAIVGMAACAASMLCDGRGELRAEVGEQVVPDGEVDLHGDLVAPGRYAVLELVWAREGEGQGAASSLPKVPPDIPANTRLLTDVARPFGAFLQVTAEWDGEPRMRLLIPASGGASTSPVSPPVDDSQVQAVGTILVVDDDAAVRALAVTALERNGCVVHAADDGDTGVATFERLARLGVLDAVVLDLTMPRVSGPEALRRMRAIAPDVPVLVTSGYDADEVLRQLGGLRPEGILPKPAPLHKVVEGVQRVLRARYPQA